MISATEDVERLADADGTVARGEVADSDDGPELENRVV